MSFVLLYVSEFILMGIIIFIQIRNRKAMDNYSVNNGSTFIKSANIDESGLGTPRVDDGDKSEKNQS